MRLNRYVAQASGISRRAADIAIENGRVKVNGQPGLLGQEVKDTDTVTLDGQSVAAAKGRTTIMLNKPVGYVCSRDGQGSKTVYDLLPAELHKLKPVGRLDKDSSGLLLLTDDGELANRLTHPSFKKAKIYEVKLDRDLSQEDFGKITTTGVWLDDGLSKLGLDYMDDKNTEWKVTMHEGRNRQIRRTFASLGYKVIKLHRTHFGPYTLENLADSKFKQL